MLYKTGVEYGDYTMNHVLGCSHGCKYPCYAYLSKLRFGQVHSYEEWCKPTLVTNTLELLDQEIPKLKNSIRIVQLCFTTDPFMNGYTEIQKMSLQAIQKLNYSGIKCSVLTKGILPLDLAHFNKQNEYGITIISLDETFREKMEPGAVTIAERISSLETLHDKGCKTWVSIEPYPTPNIIQQDIMDILEKMSFVDKIIFGRMNYNKAVTTYKDYKNFYNAVASKVISFCNEKNISYHIKNKTIS